jgi:hypothetical protein
MFKCLLDDDFIGCCPCVSTKKEGQIADKISVQEAIKHSSLKKCKRQIKIGFQKPPPNTSADSTKSNQSSIIKIPLYFIIHDN